MGINDSMQVTELKSQVRTVQNERETLLQEVRNVRAFTYVATSLPYCASITCSPRQNKQK